MKDSTLKNIIETNKNFKSMKNIFYLILLSFAPLFVTAQVHVIAPNGNTGVGTNTPSEKLEVNGSVLVQNHFKSVGPNGPQLLMTLDGFGDFVMNRDALANFGGKPSGAIFCVGSNRMFDLRNSANQFMFRVREADGFVGIGTNNPNYKLHLVSGNAGKPGGGMWVATSDKRSKNEINAFTKGLETLRLINPVSFKYNGRFGTVVDDRTHIGLIAQEVEKYAPEMVLENTFQEIESSYTEETGTVEKVLYEEKYLSVDPSELTYILINSAKELQAKVERLEAEIEILKREQQVDKGFNSNFESGMVEQAILKQNVPNPFSKITNIDYYLPESSSTASIKVFNLVGKELMTANLTEKGNNRLELNMADLPNGMYIYSLIVDGRIIDSKQMILE